MATLSGTSLTCSDGTVQSTFPLGISDIGQYRLCFWPRQLNGSSVIYAMATTVAGSSLYYDVRTGGFAPTNIYANGNPGNFPTGSYSYSVVNTGSWKSMHAFRFWVSTTKSTYNNWWPLILFQRYA